MTASSIRVWGHSGHPQRGARDRHGCSGNRRRHADHGHQPRIHSGAPAALIRPAGRQSERSQHVNDQPHAHRMIGHGLGRKVQDDGATTHSREFWGYCFGALRRYRQCRLVISGTTSFVGFRTRPDSTFADPIWTAVGEDYPPTRARARGSGTPRMSRLVIVAAPASRIPLERWSSAMANTAA